MNTSLTNTQEADWRHRSSAIVVTVIVRAHNVILNQLMAVKRLLVDYSDVQSQKAVPARLSSNQLLSFDFAGPALVDTATRH